MSEIIHIDSHDVEITHGDKLLFPEISKRSFVTYHARIADTMIPHMQHRPVTMHRFPHGIHKEGFYHKNAPDYFPDWMQLHTVAKKEGGSTRYVICNDAASLVYVANYDCITPHIWLSTVGHIEKPNRLIFDLDPSERDIPTLKDTARNIKKIIETCGLTPFIMTTGSRGFHIVIPIQPDVTFDPARHFANSIAEHLADEYPETLTTAIRKKARDGRIFLDTNRIAYAQTGVAPYAVRAREHAPIATPITWDELDTSDLVPQSYTIENIFRRLGQIDDPWKDIDTHAGSIHEAQKRFDTQYTRNQ